MAEKGSSAKYPAGRDTFDAHFGFGYCVDTGESDTEGENQTSVQVHLSVLAKQRKKSAPFELCLIYYLNNGAVSLWHGAH